jgi:hypothetical protein
MTPEAFECRAFWTLTEVLDMLERRAACGRRQMRDWLRDADVVTVNAAGARIVTRVLLEERMPDLLETMRRICEFDNSLT